MNTTDPAYLTAPELARRAGITARQLHHWTSCGYVRAAQEVSGSGIPNTYAPGQVRKCCTIAALVHVLAMSPERAARLTELAGGE